MLKTRNTQHLINLFLIGAALLLLAMASRADNVIFSAVYKGNYSGWNLEMTRQLVQTDTKSFSLNSYAKSTFASITETSVFTLDNNLFWPQHYAYKRRIFGKSAEEKIDFNWLNKSANAQRSGRKENTTHTLEAGMLDPALYQLQMQKDLANGKQPLSYTFIKRKDIKHYSFAQTGKDEFLLNNKRFNAIIVERTDGTNTRQTRVWLLPELDFQIARIQQKEESGDTYSIELASYSADNEKLTDFYKISKLATAK